MDELVAFALEGDPEASSIRTREVTRTITDDLVKSEPEDSIDPVREMTPLTGDDESMPDAVTALLTAVTN